MKTDDTPMYALRVAVLDRVITAFTATERVTRLDGVAIATVALAAVNATVELLLEVDAAGLAALGCGEGTPADTAPTAAKASRPAASFEEAAAALGHDVSTTAGAEQARHDHRVWDLVGGTR